MLSFTVTQDGAALQIKCDTAGMGALLNKLASLLATAGGQVHLLADPLSEMSPNREKAFREVVIDFSEGGLTKKED